MTFVLPSQVHSLSLVLRKKTNELAKASVSKLFTHMEMIGECISMIQFVKIRKKDFSENLHLLNVCHFQMEI